ncbi:MAG TPA: hypothetical protein VF284_12330 [Rhodanobacteraceae bacterium]
MLNLLTRLRSRYPDIRRALWSKTLPVAALSFVPLLIVLTPGMLPIDMVNGEPAPGAWNAMLGLMRFSAAGAALVGVILLLLTVALAWRWFRARRHLQNPFAGSAADVERIAEALVEMIPSRDGPSLFRDVRPPR